MYMTFQRRRLLLSKIPNSASTIATDAATAARPERLLMSAMTQDGRRRIQKGKLKFQGKYHAAPAANMNQMIIQINPGRQKANPAAHAEAICADGC
jgi:hypothetical protein